MKMFKIVLFAVFLVGCQANVAPLPQHIYCGEIPNNVYSCLSIPKIIKPEITSQCKKNNECERMTCIFRQSGWLDGNNVDKDKTKAFFEQFAKDHPEWSAAVQYVKSYCLSFDLPTQGIHFDCPAYDVMTCALTGFLRSAPESLKSSSPDCTYPKQFAAMCPICPESCFRPAIPIGSCNSCLTLPHSP